MDLSPVRTRVSNDSFYRPLRFRNITEASSGPRMLSLVLWATLLILAGVCVMIASMRSADRALDQYDRSVKTVITEVR